MTIEQNSALSVKIEQLNNFLRNDSSPHKNYLSTSFWESLQHDEALLIQLMNTPTPPSPSAPGNIEFSWTLYYLNVDLISVPLVGKELYNILKYLDMPDSQITPSDWTNWMNTWEGEGVLMGDGTLMATQLYAQMDPAWSLAILDFLLLKVHLTSIAPFNHNPNTISFNPSTQTSLSIAIMGDWGTGNYQDGPSRTSPSTQVMAAIAALKPDILVHLGDVYYAGTSSEEQINLVDAWQYKAPLGNFTLNSNHEMYSGANDYYNVALGSGLFNQTGPNGSQPTSYFSIDYGNWVILGLDSAYNATGMYMDGVINDPYQPAFIAQASAGKNVIVLTHHNPIDTVGQNKNSLWNDVTGANALNAEPQMWYWGHIHNGIVYSNESACGSTTKGRCIGNGSIPIGNAQWLENQTTVDFYTNAPLNDGTPNNALRVKNGFCILTITNGVISETWYDQDGIECWNS